METSDLIYLGIGAGASYYYTKSLSKDFVSTREAYLIYTDTTNTYAINGNNGIVEYKNPDSASTIQYAIDHSNNGTVYIRSGSYNITSPINLGSDTNKNRSGTSLVGQRSTGYTGTILVGNTGDRKSVIETTGSDNIYLSGIGIVPGSTNPSGIGIIQARNSSGTGNNHYYQNIFINMASNSFLNGGLGSVGIMNISSKNSRYFCAEIWANIGFLLSSSKIFPVTNSNISGENTYTVDSYFGYIIDGGDASSISFTGENRMISYDYFRPSFYNYGGSNIDLGNTYMSMRSSGSVSTGQCKHVMELWDTTHLNQLGNIEGSSIYMLVRGSLRQIQSNIILASTNEIKNPVIYLYDDGRDNVFNQSDIILYTYDTSRYLISGKRHDGNTSSPLRWSFSGNTFRTNIKNIDPRVQYK